MISPFAFHTYPTFEPILQQDPLPPPPDIDGLWNSLVEFFTVQDIPHHNKTS